jgi:hypothetical protein
MRAGDHACKHASSGSSTPLPATHGHLSMTDAIVASAWLELLARAKLAGGGGEATACHATATSISPACTVET